MFKGTLISLALLQFKPPDKELTLLIRPVVFYFPGVLLVKENRGADPN
jgi:hypothetical protein